MSRSAVYDEIAKAQNGSVFIAYIAVTTGKNGCLYFDTKEEFLGADINDSDLIVLRAYVDNRRYCYHTIKEIKDALSK